MPEAAVDVMDVARRMDEGEDIEKIEQELAQPSKPEPEKAPKEPEPEAKAPGGTDGGQPPPEAKQPADSSLKAQEAAQKDAKPKSKYASEQERRERTWQEINAEKEALKAERQKLDDERRKVEAELAKKREGEPFRDQHGLTAADYEKAEAYYKEQGDDEQAALIRKAASSLREAEKQHRQQIAQVRFKQNLDSVSKQHPEILDPKSEFYQRVDRVLLEYPLLQQHPDGLFTAVRAAELMDVEKTLPNLRAENEKLKQQLEALNKKLSLNGSDPTDGGEAGAEKTLDQMNSKERETYLRQLAKAADREAGL